MFVRAGVFGYSKAMRSRSALTLRQAQVYSTLVHYLEIDHHPTIKELAEHMGVCKITVHEHLQALIKKGYVTRTKYMSRSTALVEPVADEYVEGRRVMDELARLRPVIDWLALNEAHTPEDILDLLARTNDNPNIIPLPEDYTAE